MPRWGCGGQRTICRRVLTFHCVGIKDEAQVVKLGSSTHRAVSSAFVYGFLIHAGEAFSGFSRLWTWILLTHQGSHPAGVLLLVFKVTSLVNFLFYNCIGLWFSEEFSHFWSQLFLIIVLLRINMLTNMYLYHSLSLACIVLLNDTISCVSDGKVGHFLWHDDDMEFLMLPQLLSFLFILWMCAGVSSETYMMNWLHILYWLLYQLQEILSLYVPFSMRYGIATVATICHSF